MDDVINVIYWKNLQLGVSKLQTSHQDSQTPPTSASSCNDDEVGGRQLGDISADGVAELVTQGTLEETSRKCHAPGHPNGETWKTILQKCVSLLALFHHSWEGDFKGESHSKSSSWRIPKPSLIHVVDCRLIRRAGVSNLTLHFMFRYP